MAEKSANLKEEDPSPYPLHFINRPNGVVAMGRIETKLLSAVILQSDAAFGSNISRKWVVTIFDRDFLALFGNYVSDKFAGELIHLLVRRFVNIDVEVTS